MAKYFSFVAKNITPVSQNNRSTATINRLQRDLVAAHNQKYPNDPMPKNPQISSDPLCAKVFYIHRVPDFKDADNISKPLWDALNGIAYVDDRQIRYLETFKIDESYPGLFEIDITEIDTIDLSAILDFFENIQNDQDRILYVSISDHENSNVRFI
ncbi:MAG: RusA family crossover junction endodeoxyribonuclease [Saprospiraceae bacterium]